MKKKIYEMKYEYISFDIFDTLIRRLVYHPHQVFSLMQSYAEINDIYLPDNFKEIRVKAEQKASKEKSYIDIYDIYKNIKEFSSENERRAALELEIKAEIDLCVPNKEMIDIYQKCIDYGKYVIITSDMYLPKKYIINILEHCNIRGYKRLYVSCDEKADKRNGMLFRKIINDLQVSPGSVIHIGDNKKSDFLSPKRLGLKSILYHYKDNQIYTVRNFNDIAYKNQQAFINSMLDLKYKEKKDYVDFRLGYIGLGPLLLGFTKWLEKCLNEDGIEKVFFLSRDGKIMLDAYETVNGKIPHQYLYASRRALIVPIIWKYPGIKDVFKLFFTSKQDTVYSVIEKLGLSAEQYKDVLKDYGLEFNEYIDWENIEKTNFSKFYESIKEQVIENSKEQFNLLCNYLNRIGFKGNVAIVDIGWYGNMQRAMVETLKECGINASIYGYYIGIRPDSKTVEENNLKVRGYLFEKGYGELLPYQKSINALFEFIFSATHGTVLGYKRNNINTKKIDPILGKYEYDLNLKNSKDIKIYDEKMMLIQIQKAAMLYIIDSINHKFYASQEFSSLSASKNMIEIGMHPIKKDLNAIGDIRVVGADANHHYLAKPQKLSNYLKNPSGFKYDLSYTGWRVGFIKRLLRIPLPYAEFYFKIRKVSKKID